MNKWISFFAIIAVLALSSIACQFGMNSVGSNNMVTGSGNVVQEERPVSGISAVRVANQGDLQIEIGDEERLVIEAEDNLMQYLKSDVSSGRLTLGTQPLMELKNTKPIRYLLTVKGLNSLAISSSGNITSPTLHADIFSIESSSSGDISLDGLTADQLNVEISSSGDVTINSGAVTKQTVSVSSSGNYNAQPLQCQEADVSLSSSGEASLSVSQTLTGRISSSGNLKYWGDPDVNVSTSSSGEAIEQD